jgi:phage shock protein C
VNDILNNPGGKPPRGSFRLDKANSKLFGVCSGIGNCFDVDPMLVRIAFVVLASLGFSSPLLLYLAIALIAD